VTKMVLTGLFDMTRIVINREGGFSHDENGSGNAFYMQLDIKNYFMSIEKEILFDLIAAKEKDEKVLYIASKLIFHDCSKDYVLKGDRDYLKKIAPQKSLFYTGGKKGLPIGNLTSQFFANVYLNELDQFVKHRLKCRYYLRYCDDFVKKGDVRKEVNNSFDHLIPLSVCQPFPFFARHSQSLDRSCPTLRPIWPESTPIHAQPNSKTAPWHRRSTAGDCRCKALLFQFLAARTPFSQAPYDHTPCFSAPIEPQGRHTLCWARYGTELAVYPIKIWDRSSKKMRLVSGSSQVQP
jgi:hypothetical protein